MNRKSKYHKFNSKLTNKVIPRSVKVKNVMSQNQIKLVSMKSQAVAYKKKNVPIHTVFSTDFVGWHLCSINYYHRYHLN